MTINHQTFHFNLENTQFFAQYWQPLKTEAILVLVHGMGEHSSRYAGFFVDSFCKHNIAVVAFDQFGHGKTEGKRGHTPSYQANLDSITKIISLSNEKLGDLPTFLYGHSMGGNLVANYVLRTHSTIIGAVISSPMLRLAFTPPAWKLKVGQYLRNIYPTFTEKTGLEVSAISKDSAEVKKYENDPLVHDKITINYSLPFFEAGEWAIKNANTINKKVFVFHGSADRITDANASKEFADNCGELATFKLYEDGYHELHNDTCKEEVLLDVINWIESFLYTSFRI